ncbi:MAG: hypothetical protein HFK08_04020 [Clostridia bacterium]|nr:hypothetical protein [Clostridia bacterium]
MTERDFMRIFESCDGEISMSDFSPDELEEIASLYETDVEAFKRKYFEFHDDVKSPSLKKQDW